MVGEVTFAGRERVVIEPRRKDEEWPAHAGCLQGGHAVQPVRGDRDPRGEDLGQARHDGIVPPAATDDVFSVAAGSVGNTLDVLANDSSGPDAGESLTIIAVGGLLGAIGLFAYASWQKSEFDKERARILHEIEEQIEPEPPADSGK